MKTEGFPAKTNDSESSKQALTEGSNRQTVYLEALAARTVLYQAKNKAVVKLGELRRRRRLFYNLAILNYLVVLLMVVYNFSSLYLSSEKLFEERVQKAVVNGLVLGCMGISGGILLFLMPYNYKTKELEYIIQNANEALYNLDAELFGIKPND